LAALFVPAALFDRMPGFAVLLVAGTCFLLLLTLTRPPTASTDRGGRADVGPALGTAALVTALALVTGPLAAALPFYGSVRAPGGWGDQGIGGPLRLSTDLDMRSSLAARSDRPLLRYATSDPGVGPLRMYTMTDFDGAQWRRGPEPPRDALDPAEGLLWPTDPTPALTPRDEDAEGRSPTRMSIEVGDLDQDRLPVPTDPRSIEVSGRWLYDAVRDEVVSPGAGTRGLSYLVEITSRDLSAEVLAQDSAGTSAMPPDSPALQVPATPFADEIAAVAAEVTSGAGTAYDQALALQTYLRDASTFRYDPQVPEPVTEDAVYDFLTARTGYCVQFATTMAVMARSLGIPARLAVGFLPGRPDGEVRGEYVVTARQSHAWPELYFDDAGWVRFEPTPAVQTGAPPVYADPFVGSATQAPTPMEAEPVPAPVASQPQGAQAGGTGARVGIGSASVPLAVVLVVATLLVLLVAAGVVLLRRRRTTPVPRGPEEAWRELRAALGLAGLTWSDATTPRQAAALVRARYAEVLAGHDEQAGAAAAVDQAATALERLVSAVENERYAPERTSWNGVELAELVPAAVSPLVQPRPLESVSGRVRPGDGPSAARGG
jgi:transglutaminase-like putative cysteine protease